MQLQAERDHFVHSGIGGGSSSSSSSSPTGSPPKNSPLSHIKVNNLKKPRLKGKDKDSVKSKSDKNPNKKSKNIINVDNATDVNLNKENNMDIVVDLSEENQLVSLGNNDNAHVSRMSIDTFNNDNAAIDSASTMHGSLLPSQFQTQFNSFSTSIVPPPPPPPPPSTITLAPRPFSLDAKVATASTSTTSTITTTTTYNNYNTTTINNAQASGSWTVSSKPSPSIIFSNSRLLRSLTESHPPVFELSSNTFVVKHSSDRLSSLPSELFYNVLCLLDAQDLSRVAQVNKLCARMVSDNGIWKIKSVQHPLFSERRFQNQQGTKSWLAYYKFLHRNSQILKQNWADARPQAVHVLEGHTGLISSLEMSMWTLVTASTDSTLRIWDLRTLKCVQVLRSKQSLSCVAQSESAGAACARTSFG
ncbi:hypothetical protein BGZ46_010880, partial [Entomortierella lignicola]